MNEKLHDTLVRWHEDGLMKKYMMMAEDMAQRWSNCNSRKLGCVIVDSKTNEVFAEGANHTCNPICWGGRCFKRMMGADEGHSGYCNAVHAEEMAAQYAYDKQFILDPPINPEGPLVAVMNCGHPCQACLPALVDAKVVALILKHDRFYTPEDETIFKLYYADLFEVYVFASRIGNDDKKCTPL